MEKKNIAVLIASYNNEAFLNKALDSVLEQTYAPSEIIVVDDASTDASWNILQSYAQRDSRIHIHKNEKNLGIAKTRNKLFSLVSPEVDYIAVLDSDDVMTPTRIEQQVQYLETHPAIRIVGSAVTYIAADGTRIRERGYREKWCGKDSRALFQPIVANGASMFRRGVFEEVGAYDESLQGAEDYDFWLRVLSRGECMGNIQASLLQYRLHDGQGTMQHNKNNKHGFQVRWKYLWSGFFSIRGLVVTLATGFLALLPRPLRNTVRVMAIKLTSY